MAHGPKGEPMEAPVAGSPYLTYEEAARYCNVERTTIWRAAKAGRLQASGPGMAVRFHRDELDRWGSLFCLWSVVSEGGCRPQRLEASGRVLAG
jgi:excisionase family DNA binding protein